MIKRLLRLVGRWARKPVNHTNRMDVVCCYLIDRHQSVPQLPYNRTLQFPKTFRLNMNTIFSRFNNAVIPLGNSFLMLYVYNFNVTVKKYLHVLALDYIASAASGKVGPVKPVNHTSWVAVVTPTDRPKSVRNRCLIELFCGVVCVVTLPFWHFCWCRGFCHRTESDLFLFLFRRKLCITEGEQLRIRKKWNLYIFVQQNALIDIKISIIDICYRNMAPIPKPMMFSLLHEWKV